MNIDRVLYPTDFSTHSAKALPFALFFAELTSAELHLLHVSPFDAALSDDALFDRVKAELQKALEDCAGLASRHRLIHRRDISASNAIVEYAEAERIDLIVIGTQCGKGKKDFFLGSVGEKVVRYARCNVLCIHQKGVVARRPDNWRLLVPVDFSSHSRRTLRVALSLAHQTQGEIDILHVVGREKGIVKEWKTRPGDSGDARDAMSQLMANLDNPGVTVRTHIKKGYVPTEISHFAKKNKVGMVIMSVRGVSDIKRFELGSVTERVLHLVPCPVLAYRV